MRLLGHQAQAVRQGVLSELVIFQVFLYATHVVQGHHDQIQVMVHGMKVLAGQLAPVLQSGVGKASFFAGQAQIHQGLAETGLEPQALFVSRHRAFEVAQALQQCAVVEPHHRAAGLLFICQPIAIQLRGLLGIAAALQVFTGLNQCTHVGNRDRRLGVV